MSRVCVRAFVVARTAKRLFIYIESIECRKRIEGRKKGNGERERAGRRKRDELSGFTCCVPAQTRKELETIESTKFIYIYRDEARQLWLKYVFMRGDCGGKEKRRRREENKGRRGKRRVVGATCSYNFDSLLVPAAEQGVAYVDGEERTRETKVIASEGARSDGERREQRAVG